MEINFRTLGYIRWLGAWVKQKKKKNLYKIHTLPIQTTHFHFFLSNSFFKKKKYTMDARKSRGGSSSKSTRGRGRGRGFRPQVPNQQQQYPQQRPYYPQPPPPMNPQQQQYLQQQYYTQPPPPPPMNPNEYNISMTSEFDPFGDYRDGPSRRDVDVERELPLYDDDEDEDVEFVPETQPQTHTGINLYLYVC